ncbi:MAG TPA: alpha/beta fold hydrolase [Aggregatilineales bacterium]|nr:alpha/beta fold hydrolase [Aggregatilineales bacterium]
MIKKLLGIVGVFLIVFATVAQEDTTKVPVELEASDGLILMGDFYPQTEPSIAILLLHMNGSDRNGWSVLIPELQEAGYSVLAVDMRGFGKTGGAKEWTLAQEDVQVWLDWLKLQENVSGIAIVGASVGAGLGLIGCANDPDCQTVVALSPGEDFFGVEPADAISTGLADRPILLVASQGDTDSADAVRAFAQIAQGIFSVQMYDRSQHGTGYFVGRGIDQKIALIIGWLDEYALIPTE